MKGKTILGAIVAASSAILLILLLTLSRACAAETVILKAGPDIRGARGEAVILDVGGGPKEVVITAQDLKPNEVYTVWLVNMEPKMAMAGLGTGDYAFTSDARGKGTYTATISGADLDKWRFIEVAHHPDRDPMNMKNMGVALKGELK